MHCTNLLSYIHCFRCLCWSLLSWMATWGHCVPKPSTCMATVFNPQNCCLSSCKTLSFTGCPHAAPPEYLWGRGFENFIIAYHAKCRSDWKGRLRWKWWSITGTAKVPRKCEGLSSASDQPKTSLELSTKPISNLIHVSEQSNNRSISLC